MPFGTEPKELMKGLPIWSSNDKGRKTGIIKMLRTHGCVPDAPEKVQLKEQTLSFYPDHFLVQTTVIFDDKQETKFFIWKEQGEFVELNWTSQPVYKLNANGALKLNKETVADYLRFFCDFVCGEEGPFTVIEGLDSSRFSERSQEYIEKAKFHIEGQAELVEAKCLPVGKKEGIMAIIKPLEIQEEDGKFTTGACIWYGSTLFETKFRVRTNGLVEMEDDHPFVELLSTGTTLWHKAHGKPVPKEKFHLQEIFDRDEKIRLLNSLAYFIPIINNQYTRISRQRLPFYKDYDLYEVMINARGKKYIHFLFSEKKFRFYHLDWSIFPILEFNHENGLNLESEVQIAEYLKFFCGHVLVNESPLSIIESADDNVANDIDFNHANALDEITAVSVTKIIKENDENQAEAKAFVLQSGGIYPADYTIRKNGNVWVDRFYDCIDDSNFSFQTGLPWQRENRIGVNKYLPYPATGKRTVDFNKEAGLGEVIKADDLVAELLSGDDNE